jgi:ADP-heptose:LPS heptosyltransferase
MSSVLIARMDNAGDVLMAGPAIRAVAAADGPVTLLVGERGRMAAELLPGVGEIVTWTAPWIDPEPNAISAKDALALVGLLRRRFGRAFIFTSFHQSPLPLALLLRMADVPEVAAACEDYPGSLLDVRFHPSPGAHEVERSLELVGALGYRLPAGDDGRLQILRTAQPPGRLRGRRYVVVHPGASVPARTWHPKRWERLVGHLTAAGRCVVVTGGPGERALTAQVAGRRRRWAVDLGGRTTLAELAEVLAGADAVVVGNTGPAHLAAAAGTPVVSLHAPTVPLERWRPWKVPMVAFGDQQIECAGCRARSCPRPGHPCLGSIDPGDVAAAVAELAEARGSELSAVPA